MKNFLSFALAALLVGTAASAFADPSPNPPPAPPSAPPQGVPGTGTAPSMKPLDNADKSMDSIALKITAVKQCLARADALKTSIAEKRTEIAGENGGAVPAAYDDVLAAKNTRLTRVRGACLALDKDLSQQIEQTRNFLRAFPSNTAGVTKRRERLSSLQTLANSLIKRLH